MIVNTVLFQINVFGIIVNNVLFHMNKSGNDCQHCLVSGESTGESGGDLDCQNCAVSGESTDESGEICQHRYRQHVSGHLRLPVLLLAYRSCGHLHGK